MEIQYWKESWNIYILKLQISSISISAYNEYHLSSSMIKHLDVRLQVSQLLFQMKFNQKMRPYLPSGVNQAFNTTNNLIQNQSNQFSLSLSTVTQKSSYQYKDSQNEQMGYKLNKKAYQPITKAYFGEINSKKQGESTKINSISQQKSYSKYTPYIVKNNSKQQKSIESERNSLIKFTTQTSPYLNSTQQHYHNKKIEISQYYGNNDSQKYNNSMNSTKSRTYSSFNQINKQNKSSNFNLPTENSFQIFTSQLVDDAKALIETRKQLQISLQSYRDLQMMMKTQENINKDLKMRMMEKDKQLIDYRIYNSKLKNQLEQALIKLSEQNQLTQNKEQLYKQAIKENQKLNIDKDRMYKHFDNSQACRANLMKNYSINQRQDSVTNQIEAIKLQLIKQKQKYQQKCQKYDQMLSSFHSLKQKKEELEIELKQISNLEDTLRNKHREELRQVILIHQSQLAEFKNKDQMSEKEIINKIKSIEAIYEAKLEEKQKAQKVILNKMAQLNKLNNSLQNQSTQKNRSFLITKIKLEEAIQISKNEIQSLETTIQQLTRSNQQYQQTVKLQKTDIQTLEEKIQSQLILINEDLKKDIQKNNQIQSKYASELKQKCIESLQKEALIIRLKNQTQRLKEQLEKNEKKAANISEKIQKISKENFAQIERLQNSRETLIVNFKAQKISLEQKIEDYKTKLKQKSDQLNDNLQKILLINLEYEKYKSDSQKTINNLRDNSQSEIKVLNKKYQIQKNITEKRINELETNLQSLQKEKENWNNKYEQNSKINRNEKIQLQQYKVNVEVLILKLKNELQKQNVEVQTLRIQKLNQQAAYLILEKQANQLRLQINSLNKQLKDIKESFVLSEKKNQIQIQAIRQEIIILNKENEVYKNKSKDHEINILKLQEYEAVIKQMKDERQIQADQNQNQTKDMQLQTSLNNSINQNKLKQIQKISHDSRLDSQNSSNGKISKKKIMRDKQKLKQKKKLTNTQIPTDKVELSRSYVISNEVSDNNSFERLQQKVNQKSESVKIVSVESIPMEAELVNELQYKNYLIFELNESIEGYKELVARLKDEVKNYQNASQGKQQILGQLYEYYLQILQIFNIQWIQPHQQTPPPQQKLINAVNNFTKRIQDLMKAINILELQLEKVSNQNIKIKSEQQMILKKCQFMISSAQIQNDELIARCHEIHKRLSNADGYIQVLQRLLDQSNLDCMKSNLREKELKEILKNKESQAQLVQQEKSNQHIHLKTITQKDQKNSLIQSQQNMSNNSEQVEEKQNKNRQNYTESKKPTCIESDTKLIPIQTIDMTFNPLSPASGSIKNSCQIMQFLQIQQQIIIGTQKDTASLSNSQL